MSKNPLEETEYPSQSTNESDMQYLGAISKMTEWSWFIFQGKPTNFTVIQVYALTTDAKEAEVDWFYENLQHFLEPTWKKKMPFSSQETGMQK